MSHNRGKCYTFISFLRLSRLLHKHKFTEAENFAIQFGLDVEVSGSYLPIKVQLNL